MSQAIPLELPPRDPRAELQNRLQNAPLEHAEALLSAYEVLQELHDRGVLDQMLGALGSRDKVVEIIVESAKSPEAIRGLRNLFSLAKVLGNVEPEFIEGFARSLPEAIALTKAQGANPPGFWGFFKKLTKRNSRRGMFFATTALESFGKNLPN
jgi:uncharacterized protein YjgD (DUF1641 family)